MECDKNFACVRNEFANVSRTKRFADEFFTCVEKEPWNCSYSQPFGYSYFCTCPLFTYMAKQLHKEDETINSSFFSGSAT